MSEDDIKILEDEDLCWNYPEAKVTQVVQNLLKVYKEDEKKIEKLKRQAKMSAEAHEKAFELYDKTIDLILDDIPYRGYTKEELFRSYENRAKNILESEVKDE